MWTAALSRGLGLSARRVLGSSRSFSTEVAKVGETAAPASGAKGSSIGQRLTAFSAGVVATMVFGYSVLRRDVYEAAENVDANIIQLHKDIMATNAALQARTAALEQRVEQLEQASGGN